MAKINKDELLVKIATILRMPIINVALAGGGPVYAYNKEMIQEILDDINALFVARSDS